MKETLIIIGAGGQGKVAADIAVKMNCYSNVAFLDDERTTEVMGFMILGKTSDFEHWINEAEFFVAIGNSKVREKYMNRLKACDAMIATLFHPNAVIGLDAKVGKGSIVMPGAIISPNAKIGEGAIINTSSSVDHDSIVGDYSHVSAGANVGAIVEIGEHVMIGMGAIVISSVSVCSDCMVGAGAVVVKNLVEQGTYVGVPARKTE